MVMYYCGGHRFVLINERLLHNLLKQGRHFQDLSIHGEWYEYFAKARIFFIQWFQRDKYVTKEKSVQ